MSPLWGEKKRKECILRRRNSDFNYLEAGKEIDVFKNQNRSECSWIMTESGQIQSWGSVDMINILGHRKHPGFKFKRKFKWHLLRTFD